MPEPLILAIDTATSVISLALHDGVSLIAEMTWQAAGHHTQELPPMLHSILDRAGVQPQQLGAIALALGPGSYTGLRIGMSLAKGIALACDPPIPLVGVPTLNILTAAQPHLADQLIAVTQAGRGRVNAGFYSYQQNRWETSESPIIATWADLIARIDAPTQLCGEIDAAGHAALAALGDRVMIASAAQSLRRAGYLAEIAYSRLRSGQVDNPATLAPIYTH